MTVENYMEETRLKLEELKSIFNQMEWYAEVLDPVKGRYGFSASENPNLEYHYSEPESDSGLFLTVGHTLDKESQSIKCVLHINNLVINRKKRGQGLGKDIVEEIISTFEPENIAVIEGDDYSNGFWEHIIPKFPEVNFDIKKVEER